MQRDDRGITTARTGWRKSGHSNPSGACVEVACVARRHAPGAAGAPADREVSGEIEKGRASVPALTVGRTRP